MTSENDDCGAWGGLKKLDATKKYVSGQQGYYSRQRSDTTKLPPATGQAVHQVHLLSMNRGDNKAALDVGLRNKRAQWIPVDLVRGLNHIGAREMLKLMGYPTSKTKDENIQMVRRLIKIHEETLAMDARRRTNISAAAQEKLDNLKKCTSSHGTSNFVDTFAHIKEQEKKTKDGFLDIQVFIAHAQTLYLCLFSGLFWLSDALFGTCDCFVAFI